MKLSNDTYYSNIDVGLQCHNSSTDDARKLWEFKVITIPVMLVLHLIIIALFFILRRKKSLLREDVTRLCLGFLYIDYKEKYYAWEFIRFLVKALCLFVTVGYM
jgi:hypothetical protein